jgi:adenosylcobinamide kinase / adenosylcobinamide-phosphate guanylyltransferase
VAEVVNKELVLGGARSGKSRWAEARAQQWLAQTGHPATLLATAQAGDAQMAERIARHRADRAQRVPGLATLELPAPPQALVQALHGHGAENHLLVVDCLTLWLTQLRMPLTGPAPDAAACEQAESALLQAVADCRSPLVLVSNEIGLGVLPLSPQAREVVDALGRLHQRLARLCGRVTLLVAGLPLVLKEQNA